MNKIIKSLILSLLITLGFLGLAFLVYYFELYFYLVFGGIFMIIWFGVWSELQ